MYIKAVCIYFIVHNNGSFIICHKFCLVADKQDGIRNDEFRRKPYETGNCKLPQSRNVQYQYYYIFKDGAYFCYCAYVLRISRYLGFLWVVPINTGIFLCGLNLCRESRTEQVLLIFKKKFWGNHLFFRDDKASIWKKTPYFALYFTVFRIIDA